jgi:hypothetical protein
MTRRSIEEAAAAIITIHNDHQAGTKSA